MPKLNQILAVEKGEKTRIQTAITELYKLVQKPALFSGVSKTYAPINAEGETIPPQNVRVQLTSQEVLSNNARLMTDLITNEARKDWTNTVAKADVVLDDGTVLIPGAPVSFLLFLEKQLTDMRTLVSHLPILDPAETWTFDTNASLYKTAGSQTHRTKKTTVPIVLIQPTPEHPGQAQLISEDVLAGYWTEVKQSGALAKSDKAALLTRIENVLRAVKTARESANLQDEVASPKAAEAIFNYLQPQS